MKMSVEIDCTPEEARRFLGLQIAVDLVIADPDARMTLDVVVDAGHRDAAFLMHDHLWRGPDDFRIDVSPRAGDGIEVQHHDPQRHADMRRRDPDAGRGVHRLEQIGGKLAQRVVELCHRLSGE